MTTPEAPAYVYRAVVADIYDGDTIRVTIDLGFGTWLHRQAVRLMGVDTPELKGIEREDGVRARDFVSSFCPVGSDVLIRTHKDKTGKYGRWLAEIWADGKSLGQELLNADLAVPYGEDWNA